MAEATHNTPQMEDMVSVGTRIKWGPIFAGALIALGLYFLFGLLGAAVGLTVSDRVNPNNLKIGVIVWNVLIICVSLFVGGLITSQFMVGENKVEAALYGLIMWALLYGFLLGLGALGAQSGFNAMMGMTNLANASSPNTWEVTARNAGIPEDQIEAWRRKLNEGVHNVQDPANQQAMMEAATRTTWYAFIGTWVSMMAAAAGSLLGAGPTFRVMYVPVHPSTTGGSGRMATA